MQLRILTCNSHDAVTRRYGDALVLQRNGDGYILKTFTPTFTISVLPCGRCVDVLDIVATPD